MTKVVSKENLYNSGKPIMLAGQIYEVIPAGFDVFYFMNVEGEWFRIDKCQVYDMKQWRDLKLNAVLNE